MISRIAFFTTICVLMAFSGCGSKKQTRTEPTRADYVEVVERSETPETIQDVLVEDKAHDPAAIKDHQKYCPF